MKHCFLGFLLLFLLCIIACNDGPSFNCPDGDFNVVDPAFTKVISVSGSHELQDSNGISLFFDKVVSRQSSDEFDENGCFIEFNEFYQVEYIRANQVEARVVISSEGEGLHHLSLTVSSLVNENNTNNLFEAEMNSQVEVSNCPINELVCLTNHIHNGIQYPYLLKWERTPLLPGSDLVEIVSLIFSPDRGIIYMELENGAYLNYLQ